MAKAAEMTLPVESQEDVEGAPVKKSKKKLFIIAGALVVLLGGGGAAAYFLLGSGAHPGAKTEAPKPPVFLPLDTFTVNLSGGDQYLQTDITLQVGGEEDVALFKQNMPRVRSRILTLLSGKQADDLVSAADKQKLAHEILAQMKQPFDAGGKPQAVSDILFTSFVIQ
jgi:Flagellar basal body-associated protein